MDICKPCPVGTYQSLEAQSSCLKCPTGKSTIGIQSTTINECTGTPKFLLTYFAIVENNWHAS
jgi:hypothetical protein